MNIFFYDEDNKLTPEIKEHMQKACEIALDTELSEIIDNPSQNSIEIGVSIVSSDEIKELNNEYREIDKVTDVLSFPQFEDINDLADDIDEDIETLLGDVVICYDVAMSQAEEYGTGIMREFVYLFVHSIFHLLGYDHMQDEDKKLMRKKEDAVMEELGL